jgi:hypothetical protein
MVARRMSAVDFLKQSLVDFALDTGNKEMLVSLARDSFEVVKPGTSGFVTAKKNMERDIAYYDSRTGNPVKKKPEVESMDDNPLNWIMLYTNQSGVNLHKDGKSFIAIDEPLEFTECFGFNVHVTDLIHNCDCSYRVKEGAFIGKFTPVILEEKSSKTKICAECGESRPEKEVEYSPAYEMEVCDPCFIALENENNNFALRTENEDRSWKL